ncbi:MAG: hypothetical protein J6U53_01895 [Tidjanibacter sp.]|nr:hypothetical protein [Tidjanibacter sp.]
MRKVLLSLLIASSVATSLVAQNDTKGYVVGSFESNSIVYVDDEVTQAQKPEGNFGTNNYLKADYYLGNFSAGLQLEAYQPALIGYPANLEGARLTNYYMQWSDGDFDVTAGTFYDQFGSGILFRTYEDRTLGVNSALMGARVAYQYKNIARIKALWGAPRLGMEPAKNTQVRGVDASLSLSNLLNMTDMTLALEGSLLNRFERVGATALESGAKPSTMGYSARLNFEKSGFGAKAEWVDGGEKMYNNPNPIPGVTGNDYLIKNSNAQLLELSYSGGGLGVSLSARRLEWMESKISNSSYETNNALNYLPALCAQYSYAITNLNPYIVQPGTTSGHINSGEIGGQLDVYYNFKRGTALGGKRGMKVNLNFSTYYTLKEEGSFVPKTLLWRNVNVGVEKQVSRKFKMQLLYSMQEYNHSHGVGKGTWLSNIVVADLLYKYTPTFSTRMELAYLTTFEDKKDWMSALLEVNFAPSWSLFVSDMFNHGMTKVHYYNAGFSYTEGRTRVALSYGRNRQGMVCSGGVCRLMPAYTGGNLTISTSF